jgi:RNA polymerase sigma-70 factor, ECF subfamily
LLPLWTLAYKRYYQFWVKIARSAHYCGEDADDIVQSVVSSLLTNSAVHFDSLEHLRNYVARSVLNRLLQMKKKANRQVSWTDALEARMGGGGDRTQEPLESELAIYREAIRSLSAPDFEIIKLRFYSGLTFSEISRLLNMPVSTLKSREAAALRRLRAWIRSRGY